MDGTFRNRALDIEHYQGLDVYASMAPEEKALLKHYQLREEGFSTKIRESKPQKEEAVVQYVVRLQRYLTRWMELLDIQHSFDAVSDLMLREQFVCVLKN